MKALSASDWHRSWCSKRTPMSEDGRHPVLRRHPADPARRGAQVSSPRPAPEVTPAPAGAEPRSHGSRYPCRAPASDPGRQGASPGTTAEDAAPRLRTSVRCPAVPPAAPISRRATTKQPTHEAFRRRVLRNLTWLVQACPQESCTLVGRLSRILSRIASHRTRSMTLSMALFLCPSALASRGLGNELRGSRCQTATPPRSRSTEAPSSSPMRTSR